MRFRTNFSPTAAISAAIVLAGFVFSLAVNWPGHLSYDSVIQLLEGRSGAYADWHPPVMSWLLGVGDALVPGTALFVVFDALLAFSAFLLLLLLRPRPSRWAVPVALVCVLMPQLLLYPAIVWKDVLFACAGVTGFACLALAAGRWANAPLRFALIAGAIVLLVLAALARQNGLIVLLSGLVALAWIAAQNAADRRPLRDAARYGGGALIAAIAVMGSAYAGLSTHFVGTSGPTRQIQLLQEYDIIGAVAADPGLSLPVLEKSDPVLEKLIRTIGVRVYSPERNDTLTNSHVLTAALNDADGATIGAQWRELVAGHPWLYLRVRAEVFRWVFLTPDLRVCLPYLVGISGPAPEMRELGLAPRWDDRDDALDAYAGAFVGTPILSHAAFALLAALLLAFLLRRRQPPDIAVAFLLIGAIGFALSFFAISIACDYRYLYFLDLSALVATFYVSLEPHL